MSHKLLENMFEINYSKIKDYLKNKIETSNFKNFADTEINYSRRIGWCIIARIIKPKNHWYPGSGIGISFIKK